MERRKRARFTLNEPLDSSVQSVFNAKMLDLSMEGALLESARPLLIGTGCEIRVEHDGGSFLLNAEVRNCRAGGTEADDVGRTASLFLVGLEFNDKGRYAVNELLSRVPAFVKKNSGGTEDVWNTTQRQKGSADDRWRSDMEIPVSVRVEGRESLEPHLLELPANGADLPKPGDTEISKAS